MVNFDPFIAAFDDLFIGRKPQLTVDDVDGVDAESLSGADDGGYIMGVIDVFRDHRHRGQTLQKNVGDAFLAALQNFRFQRMCPQGFLYDSSFWVLAFVVFSAHAFVPNK